nr:hypothetical protein K-LCC10_0480 [Kaumoebavirus]
MQARKIVDKVVVELLDARLPREITDIIISHLLETPREVVKIWRANIKKICWFNDVWRCPRKRIKYMCNVEKHVTVCPRCGRVGNIKYWKLLPRYEMDWAHSWRWEVNKNNFMDGDHVCGAYKYTDGKRGNMLLPVVNGSRLNIYERSSEDYKDIRCIHYHNAEDYG